MVEIPRTKQCSALKNVGIVTVFSILVEYAYMITNVLGKVDGYTGSLRTIQIPEATLVLGPAAIGAYAGAVIGGPKGALVGSMIGACVGKLAGAGKLSHFEFTLSASGQLSVRVQCA